MLICYYIDATTGRVALEYGESKESELIQDFIQHEDVPTYNTISVQPDADGYTSDMAYKDLAMHLWNKLSDVPTRTTELEEVVEGPFLHFPKGTGVYAIWHWLEEQLGVSVAEDLMRL